MSKYEVGQKIEMKDPGSSSIYTFKVERVYKLNGQIKVQITTGGLFGLTYAIDEDKMAEYIVEDL